MKFYKPKPLRRSMQADYLRTDEVSQKLTEKREKMEKIYEENNQFCVISNGYTSCYNNKKDALTEWVRAKNILIKKEKELKLDLALLDLAQSWSEIQVAIEAENRGLPSVSDEEEATIRLEMAEVALNRKEGCLKEKRPLQKMTEE